MNTNTLAAIAIFGALGCLARYLLSNWVLERVGSGFPYGTLAVNLVGAYLIGLVMEFAIRSSQLSPSIRSGIVIGFLGGLTTFSTFSYETFKLLEDGKFVTAFGNVLASVLVCLVFTWLGIYSARQF
jgi:fluoride exporter